MTEELKINKHYDLRCHIFYWLIGAVVLAIIEGLFSLLTFDVIPVSGVSRAFVAYVLFALLAGTLLYPVVTGGLARRDSRIHTALTLFTSLLVFFDTAVLIRRTPYLMGRIGGGALLFVLSIVAALLVFLMLQCLSRKIGKPFPFFLSSIVVIQLGFLFLRLINHYLYDTTIFFEPPAGIYNAGLVILFFPAYYLCFKIFSSRPFQAAVGKIEGVGGIVLLLVVTALVYMGGDVHPSSAVSNGKPNILLIVMDTCRSDFLSCYGHTIETSPNIDGLAEEGALFQNMVATAPWTVPTHCSMFTGLYTSSHGASWEHLYLDDPITTVAELLRDDGYQTVAISNNALVGPATNLVQGFNDFYGMWKGSSRFPTTCSQIKGHLLSLCDRADAGARSTNEVIQGWLERRHDSSKPFFMFVNYFEPHLLYNPPEDWRRKFIEDSETVMKMRKMNVRTLYRMLADESKEGLALSAEEISALRGLYEAEIAYLDMRIGELVKYLGDQGYLENTFLILTADHGENIGEHNLLDHQLSLYDTTLRIPLIIRYPSLVPSGVRIKAIAQSVDVFTTILDVASLSNDNVGYTVAGKNLLSSIRGEDTRVTAYSEYMSPRDQFKRVQSWAEAKGVDSEFLSFFDRRLKSVRNDTLKYIWSSDGRDELYRISTDPGEEVDLKESGDLQITGMRDSLLQWKGSLPALLRETEEIPEMDKETRELLKALGYVD